MDSLTDIDETLTGGAATGSADLARKTRWAAVVRAAESGAEVARVFSEVEPQARLAISTSGAVTVACFGGAARAIVVLTCGTGRYQQQ